ncbi:MAG TPA: flavodoxin family protein [Chloroflexi bacterium]|nr:flavodoxin family protein [Chloroflexota bacterium]
MRVVGVIGSPRRAGNTELIVAEVLRGAADAGAQVERYRLTDMNVSPCQACNRCRTLKRCRIDDDMRTLYDEMLSAGALVLGTPIYYWGPSAQFKAFLDRWYAIDQEGIREALADKLVLLVCAYADADPRTVRPTERMLRAVTEGFNMRFVPPFFAGECWERGDAAQKPGLLARAYQAGLELAESVSM